MAETFTTLLVSTGNMPERLARMIDKDDPELAKMLLVAEKLTYGYRLWVDSSAIPDALKPLMSWAKLQGHKWVEFDCDVEPIEGFQSWDW